MKFCNWPVVSKPFLILTMVLSTGLSLWADDSASVEQRLAKLEQVSHHPGINNADSALIAGTLATITPASGFVTIPSAYSE